MDDNHKEVLCIRENNLDVTDDTHDNRGLVDDVAFNLDAEVYSMSYKQRTEQSESRQSQESSLDDGKAASDLQIRRSKHFANVAFYVVDDNTKKVYAVTNRHVTLQADEFFIQIKEKETVFLGSPIKTVKTNEGDIDVDLIEIDPSIGNLVRNKERQDQNVSIYKDSFNSIYGQEVYKYRPSRRLFEVPSCDTPKTGVIASGAEHKEREELFKEENGQFLVKSENGPFSVEGESGTALAVKTTTQNVVVLIGIICGGFDHYTLCQFIPNFFRHFDNKYGMKLQIFSCDLTSVIVSDGSPCIPFGIKISFTCIYRSPEQIAHLNFDLVDYTLTLFCLTYDNINEKEHVCLLERWQNLSLSLSKRESLQNCSVFENEKPDFVAVDRGIKACDYLYNGKAQKAEHCLKEAIFCVPKMDSFGLRVLCKHTTYITWFCLASENPLILKKLKTLLDTGIETFENDYNNLIGFPREALGYMFFDYSRYYMCKYDKMRTRANRKVKAERKNRNKAIEKASRAVGIFQQDHDSKKTKETYRRLVLAKCQHAYVLLGCGHEFNVIPDEVPTDDITEAEYIIKSVQSDEFDVPLVQQVDVLIASIDLDYRKKCFIDALEKINTCLKISEGKKYFIGYHRAKLRLEKLQDAIKKHKLV